MIESSYNINIWSYLVDSMFGEACETPSLNDADSGPRLDVFACWMLLSSIGARSGQTSSENILSIQNHER